MIFKKFNQLTFEPFNIVESILVPYPTPTTKRGKKSDNVPVN